MPRRDPHSARPTASSGGEGVRQNLAGMEKIGRESVDDGHSRRRGEALDLGMVEGADNQPVNEPRKDPGGVLDRLALPQMNVIAIEEDRIASEFVDSHLEGYPGPGARFGENQGPGLAGENVPGDSFPRFALNSRALAKTSPEVLFRLKVGLFEEVFHLGKRLSLQIPGSPDERKFAE